MKLADIFSDKSIKKMAAQTMIVDGILKGAYTIEEIRATSESLKDNKAAVILEAIEEISNKKLMDLSEAYLKFAKGYVSSADNSCKREASRIIGTRLPGITRRSKTRSLHCWRIQRRRESWYAGEAPTRYSGSSCWRNTVIRTCTRGSSLSVKANRKTA